MPFADLASGLGLLYLPKLPDLKKFQIKFDPVTAVHPSEIKFKDSSREQQRLANASSKSAKRQAEKKEREDAARKREKDKQKLAPRRSRVRTREEMEKEMSELEVEARLLKKLKKGAISLREFQQAVGEASDNDEGPAFRQDGSEHSSESEESNKSGTNLTAAGSDSDFL